MSGRRSDVSDGNGSEVHGSVKARSSWERRKRTGGDEEERMRLIGDGQLAQVDGESEGEGGEEDGIAEGVDGAEGRRTSRKGGEMEGAWRVVGEREVESFLIQHGDLIRVVPGAKIPTDGVVTWGHS